MTDRPVIELQRTYIVGAILKNWQMLPDAREVVVAAVQKFVMPYSKEFILALLDGTQSNVRPSAEALQREADLIRQLVDSTNATDHSSEYGDVADFLEQVETTFSCRSGSSHYGGPETFFQSSVFRLWDCRRCGISSVEFAAPSLRRTAEQNIPINMLPPDITFNFDIDHNSHWRQMETFASHFGVKLPSTVDELGDLRVVPVHRNRSVTHTAEVKGQITLLLELSDSWFGSDRN